MSNSKWLIAISGPDGAGKSTLAQELASLLPGKIYSFGTSLKNLAVAKNLLTKEQAFGKPMLTMHRQVLRRLAISIKAEHDDSYFAIQAVQDIALSRDISRAIIVDDLRYIVQAKALLTYASNVHISTLHINIAGAIESANANLPGFTELALLHNELWSRQLYLPSKEASPAEMANKALALLDDL